MSDNWKDDPVMAEVAAIKEEAWAEVAHLPLREAIAERLRLVIARTTEWRGFRGNVQDDANLECDDSPVSQRPTAQSKSIEANLKKSGK